MLGKQNIVYVSQELRKRNDLLRQISWPARVLSRRIVLILTKN